MNQSFFIVVAGIVFCLVGCEDKPSKTTVPVSVTIPQKESMARAFAVKVKCTIDVSTPADLVQHIPQRPEMSRDGKLDRVYRWKFDDGSAMVGYFRPKGSNEGLILDRVVIED